MKKIIAMILLSLMAVVFCVGCAEQSVVVSRVPIDVRYTEAHETIETDYKHEFDWWTGDYVLVPVVQTVRHEAKWEIRYRFIYEDGTRKTEWHECSEMEYYRVKNALDGENNNG